MIYQIQTWRKEDYSVNICNPEGLDYFEQPIYKIQQNDLEYVHTVTSLKAEILDDAGEIIKNPSVITDVTRNHSPLLAVSERFVSIFSREIGTNFHTFPLIIDGTDEEFFGLYVSLKLDFCTKYEDENETRYEFPRAKKASAMLFQETKRPHLYCTEEFKQMYEQNNLTGLEFINPDYTIKKEQESGDKNAAFLAAMGLK